MQDDDDAPPDATPDAGSSAWGDVRQARTLELWLGRQAADVRAATVAVLRWLWRWITHAAN